MFHVVAASGSLRAGSSNTGLLRMAQRLAPDEMSIEMYDGIGRLPFYNPDLEADLPDEPARWRRVVIDADALLLAMPEYNFGPSGAMKNAIDWISRPMPDHPMKGKVIACVTSGGRRGGPKVQAWAGEIMPLLGVRLVDDPVISLAMGAEVVHADGTTTDPAVEHLMRERLDNMLEVLRAGPPAV
jgi:chromate reductase